MARGKTDVRSAESRFFEALKGVFIGAEVEGESGYINLMRIKSKYFDKIFGLLQKEIEEKTREFPEFREELHDKLYSFFKRYFSESGSIFFRRTPFSERVYERVYTDSKDVVMFWKTHMLYYVKTDILPKSMEVKLDGFKFYFDVSRLQHKKANEKRELIYQLQEVRADGTIVFTVLYSERGRKTKTNEILRELKKRGIKIDEETLKRAFRVFEKQNEVDYFINKNAREFLKEQFDLWLYQYILSDESWFTEKRIKQLKVLKEIAYKIIDFIAQFEDEVLKIWRKPKFVLNSNYVITLDRIASKNRGIDVIKKIIKRLKEQEEEFRKEIDKWREIKVSYKSYRERIEAAGDIKNQVVEWYLLDIIDEDFNPEDVLVRNNLLKYISNRGTPSEKESLNPKYRFLPIDTKYFKDLELEILKLFDNLDQELDGWLIKSENWQALNTILPKFKGKIQTIYIDPPYNTGKDEFIYIDKFQHSTWLTMMENRLKLAKEMLKEDGVIFIHIDDNELYRLKNMIESEDLFEYIATFIRKTGIAPRQDVKFIATEHDYILCFGKNLEKTKINKRPANVEEGYPYQDQFVAERGRFKLNKLDRGSIHYSEKLDYPIIVKKGEIIDIFESGKVISKPAPEDIVVWPGGDPNDKRWTWRWSKEKVEWGIKNHLIVFKKVGNKWTVYFKQYQYVDNELKPIRREIPYRTLLLDFTNEQANNEIKNLFGDNIFESYPKPVELIKTLLKMSTSRDSLVMDFFAGSGTMAHAVMKLNKEDGGERKFILIEMADYFDAVIIPRIKKLAYSLNWKNGKPLDINGIGIFVKYYELEQYEDTLRRVHYTDAEPFFDLTEDPYNQYIFMRDPKLLDALEIDYENDRVNVNLEKLYKNIDIAETLSNLLGKWIRRITEDYVEFEDGERVDLKNLDYKLVKPLIWW